MGSELAPRNRLEMGPSRKSNRATALLLGVCKGGPLQHFEMTGFAGQENQGWLGGRWGVMDLVPPNIKKGKQPKALDRGQCLAGAYGSGVCGILASTGCGFIFLAKWPPTLPPTRPDRIFPDLYSSQGRAEIAALAGPDRPGPG